MKTLISVDTSCLINYEMLEKYEISVFPLNVIIEGEEYLDGKTINQEQLCEAMRSGKNIKTSTPAYGVIIEYFDDLFKKGYEHIIHFTISSKLSSMYSLFKNIAGENYEGKLTVIDSYALASAMLVSALYAYEEIQKDTSIDIILENIEKLKEKSSIVFVPENLNALKNGGRISPTIAVIANTIGIKPMIAFIDGGLEKDKMIKNTKHAIIDRFNELLIDHPIEDYDYCLINCQAKESTLEYIVEKIEEKIGKDALIEGQIPINVLAHCGPGTVGLLMTPKINGKSIKEYM